MSGGPKHYHRLVHTIAVRLEGLEERLRDAGSADVAQDVAMAARWLARAKNGLRTRIREDVTYALAMRRKRR